MKAERYVNGTMLFAKKLLKSFALISGDNADTRLRRTMPITPSYGSYSEIADDSVPCDNVNMQEFIVSGSVSQWSRRAQQVELE